MAESYLIQLNSKVFAIKLIALEKYSYCCSNIALFYLKMIACDYNLNRHYILRLSITMYNLHLTGTI